MEATRRRWKLSHTQAKGTSQNKVEKLSTQRFRSKSKNHNQQKAPFSFKSTSNHHLPSQKQFKEMIIGKQQKVKQVEEAYQLGIDSGVHKRAEVEINTLKNKINTASSMASINDRKMEDKISSVKQFSKGRSSTSIKNILPQNCQDFIKEDQEQRENELKSSKKYGISNKKLEVNRATQKKMNRMQNPYFN